MKKKKRRSRIYYYRFDQHVLETRDHGGFITETVIVKAAYTAPTHIWIKNRMIGDRNKWTKIKGFTFPWWWSWFKGIKDTAVERKEWTKMKLFEEVGMDQL